MYVKNSSSATAQHHLQTGQKIPFEETKIYVRIPYYHQQKIRETI